MRKNLRLLPMALSKIIGAKNSVKYILLGFIIFLMTPGLNAQDLKPEAQRQLKFIMAQKAAYTPAQKKIDSRILFTYKLQNDATMKANLPDLKFDDVKILSGKVKVDITLAVNAAVLNALRALDCDIIFSSEKFASVTANIPLKKLEQIAALDAVKHIELWVAPILNGQPNDNGTTDTTGKPGFTERAKNVTNLINDVIGKQPVTNDNGAVGNVMGGAGAVISEAVATHKADIVQSNFGIKGAGIKIGVLSDGVTGYATSQASGDLPAITILPGQAGNTGSEGRAMLELIHDIAPDAELYFATAFISQASFAQNILDLRAAGCDIIVDDVSYYAEGVFQDDNVARSVNSVTASGAIYFSSAGNSGNKNDGTSGVWEGDFVSGGPIQGPIANAGETGLVHDFGGGTVYNVLPTASGAYITLKWSDPLGQSANDYDLFSTNAAGTTLTAFSAAVQNGTQNPFEAIAARPAGERIYIVLFSGATRALHLNTNRGTLSISTPGVIYGHNAAASAYTVAATPAASPHTNYLNSPVGPYPNAFNSSNTVELYSSDGPRRIFFNPDGSPITPGNLLFATDGGTLLQKTDITAADGCATNTPGFQPFYGTSAAAPNAAAIAALVKSAVPDITSAQLRAALTSSAIDIEAPGADRDAGAGIVMAPEALIAAGYSSSPLFAINSTTATEGSFSNSNAVVEPGEIANLAINLYNYGLGANNVQAVLTSATSGITITQNTASYGNINGSAGANNGTPFVFGINASVPCGSEINFTLAVTYDGSASPVVLPFTYKTGKKPDAIIATLGGAPATGTEFVSTSGIQTGRLFRSGVGSTCATVKANPGPSGTASLAYHAYTFTNTGTASQCVDVLMTSPAANKFHLAYNNNGFVPSAVSTNYLADPGSSFSYSKFSFEAPAGQNFTIVVNDVSGGDGNYNLNVGLLGCSTAPECTPVVIAAPTATTTIVGTPYSQAFTATGGSGAYLFALTGTLPDGLSFNGNTLSGTPTETGSFSITINAADAAGCTMGSITYQLDVVEPPAITATGTFNEFIACEGSASPEQSFTVSGTNLTDDLAVTASAGFRVSLTSGNGFASAVVLTPVSGTVSTTTVYVIKAASAPDNITGTISVTSTGAVTQDLNISGVTNAATTWYSDADGDGYGDAATTISDCSPTPPSGYVADNTDCDDTKLLYTDNDGDGFGAGSPVACGVADNTDCNDADASVHAGITYYRDADGDGFGSAGNTTSVCSSTPPSGYVTNNSDCDDTKKLYADNDGDGFGAGSPVACGVANNTDCNNSDGTVYPGAPELCDGKDNDCDGQIDEGCPVGVTISIADNSIIEGNSGHKLLRFTVKLNKKSSKKITVKFATQNNTATAGSDYIAKSGTVTFLAGVKTKKIAVKVKGDKKVEANETFNVILSNAVNASISDGTAIGTIINNDGVAIAKTASSNAASVIIADKSIKLSPNPASGRANISLTGYSGKVVILISNLNGKVLQETKLQLNSTKSALQPIDVSTYAAGVYLVIVIDEKGNRKTEKLLIAR